MTAMTSVDDLAAPEAALLPRFDDGMVNLQELVRTLAELLVNQVVDAEADQLCEGGANSSEQTMDRIVCLSPA